MLIPDLGKCGFRNIDCHRHFVFQGSAEFGIWEFWESGKCGQFHKFKVIGIVLGILGILGKRS